jgi:hypothetical protein
MIAVWPSRAGFGEQMAEAVLATALAVPVIFAFAELRDTRLVGTPPPPPQEDSQFSVSEGLAAERSSEPVRAVLSGGSVSEASVWEARLTLLMEAIRLAGHGTSETPVDSEAEPEPAKADQSTEAITRPIPSDRSTSRFTRPLTTSASETSSEAKR